MMSVWNYVILLGAAAAALVPIGGRNSSRRYLAWLGAIIAAYAVSVLYWDFGGPWPEAFGFLCDAALVASFVIVGRHVWEAWVAGLFLTSAFVNMAYLAHNIVGAGLVPHDVHGAILELINALAIGVIGATAAFDRAGHRNARALAPWLHIFGIVRPLPIRSSSRS